MSSRSNTGGEPPTNDVASPISDIAVARDSTSKTLADATLTSRISIQKFCCVVSQFSNFKRGLVTETGFGGLMHLKITRKLNLKFSSSLMFRVDPDKHVLELDETRKIRITDQDVNDVFGLPQGSRIITPGHSDLSEVCIEFTRLASSISTKGVHSLKAAEFILSKQLDENSSKVECECFKIAFVIFSFGHVLYPCAKHDYTSVDYWAALVVPSEMNSYNWCRLVKDSLMKGVRKIKSDIDNGNNTIHIVGCHLLLQVIALDKIKKSSSHISQNILPRVKVFDHDSVKKAIDSITSHQGQEVVYVGLECVLNEVPMLNDHPNQITNNICAPSSSKFPVRAASKIKPRSSIGPVEFANIMRRKYPNMADDLIGIILKEHNTRLMANMSEIRYTTQMGMLKFLDELAGCLSSRCICCQLAGLTTCRLVDNNSAGQVMGNEKPGQHEELSDGEACSSTGHVHQARKRVYVHSTDNIIDDTHIGQNKKHQNSLPGTSLHDGNQDNLSVSQARPYWGNDSSADLMSLVYYNDQLFSSIVLVYEECTGVCFSQLTDTTPPIIDLSCKSFVSDPWSLASTTHAPPADSSKIIAFCISNDLEDNMSRTWIEHPTPRLLILKGNILRDQIIGKEATNHECLTLIVRRLAQIERSNSKDRDFAIWRKFIEPDFTTLVIRNIDPMFTVSVQTELLMEKHIDQCRMFIFHTPLHFGWCCYILDMLSKRIVVLDPQAGPFGFTTNRVKFHEQISHAIHEAFFRCVQSFFSSWPCTPDGWTREFPTLMVEKIPSEHSGIYSLFMATHYDGEALRKPTTKENISSYRRGILQDVIKLEDNKSDAPYKAMRHIRASVNDL